MSNTIALSDRPSALPTVSEKVTRTPFYFGRPDQRSFAWLHRQECSTRAGHGVLICPAVGHEQVHAHRGLRHLAGALACAGFSVLRFDYHGTGDSGGSDEDAERLAAWLRTIREAHDWIRQHLGCRRISLVGLRLGATLAAQAAADTPADNLLLWAPIVKGRSYVRELKALSLATAAGGPPLLPASEGIEAAGFVFTEETLRDLGALDLLQSQPLCRRVLVLARDDSPSDQRLLEHYRALGIDVEQITAPGYADMMAEPHHGKVPQTAIDAMVAWLRAGAVESEPIAEAVYPDQSALSASMEVVSGSLRERVLPISDSPHLFGILSEPRTTAGEERPTVVLVNAGSAHRVGPNRLHVYLARCLAAQGFRTLRMDLCGLGDSATADQERENDPYPATAFRDIDLALAHLKTHRGVQRVVLMGLCSGAYAAFQSAAQLSCSVLVESVLINPLTFFWREGMALESSTAAQLQAFQDGMDSLWRPRKWLKLLTGRSKIGIAGAVRMLLQRAKLAWRSCCVSAGESTGDRGEGPPSHPRRRDLSGDLQRAGTARRHLACFLARSDPGYALLLLEARRKAKAMHRAGALSLYFLENADHTFSRREARQALAERIIEHLERRYPARR